MQAPSVIYFNAGCITTPKSTFSNNFQRLLKIVLCFTDDEEKYKSFPD